MKFLTIFPALTTVYTWMSRTGRPLPIACLFLTLSSISGGAMAVTTTTYSIANDGDAVPDLSALFSGVLPPIINSSNRVVFIASLSDTDDAFLNDSGVYSVSAVSSSLTSIQEIVRENDILAINGTNFVIDDLYPLSSSFRMDNAFGFGQLALQLPVRFGSMTGSSIIVVENFTPLGTFALIAEAGAVVASGNGTFNEFNNFTLASMTGNEVTFFSALSDTLDGNNDDTAIFRYSISALVNDSEIVREGDLNLATFAGVRTNDFGASVFLGTDDSGATVQDSVSALYRTPPFGVNPVLVVGEGDDAPTAEVDPRVFSQLSQIRINNNETLGFAATLRDGGGMAISNNSGLYTVAGGAPTLIVREGQLTPDGTASFLNFASEFNGDIPRSPFNDLGQFAFTVDLQVGGVQSIGVFRASESELIEIARRGDIYEDGTFGNFDDPALTHNGLVAFTASLVVDTIIGPEGPVVISDEILVLTDGQDFVTVARGGQMIDGKELISIQFSSSPIVGQNGLSESGIVAYKASYANGTRGINIWRAQPGWRSSANDGNWDDENNWFLGMLPKAASDVVLDTENNVDVQGPSGPTELNSLSLGNGTGMTRLFIGAGSITTSEGILINANGAMVGAGVLAGPVHNQGAIDITAGGMLELSDDVINDGIITLAAGSQLTLSGAYSGSGIINGSDGLTIFNAALSPGNSPSLLPIEGDVAFGDQAATTLELAGLVRGDDFDAIDIGGTLTLNGMLDVVLLDSFSPNAGDSFLLLQADALVGDFDVVNLPEIGGLTLLLNKTSTTLSLEVQDASSADPAPAGASGSSGSISWLLLSGLLLIIRIRSRS